MLKIKPNTDGTVNIVLDWHFANAHPYEKALKLLDDKLNGITQCYICGEAI